MSNDVSISEIKLFLEKISKILTKEQLLEAIDIEKEFSTLGGLGSVFNWEAINRIVEGN